MFFSTQLFILDIIPPFSWAELLTGATHFNSVLRILCFSSKPLMSKIHLCKEV